MGFPPLILLKLQYNPLEIINYRHQKIGMAPWHRLCKDSVKSSREESIIGLSFFFGCMQFLIRYNSPKLSHTHLLD